MTKLFLLSSGTLLTLSLFSAEALARTDRETCQIFLRSKKAVQLRMVNGVERDRQESVRACQKLIRLGRDWAKEPAALKPSEPVGRKRCHASSECSGHKAYCNMGYCSTGGDYCSTNGHCMGAEQCVDRICR